MACWTDDSHEMSAIISQEKCKKKKKKKNLKLLSAVVVINNFQRLQFCQHFSEIL